VRIPDAARLLADARSLDALRPLARAVGFHAPTLPLPRATRRALALDELPIHRARLALGPPPLRALLAEVPDEVPLRDATRTLAARLATRAPDGRWLLLLTHPNGHAVAIAAWTTNPGRPPRVHALTCDPHDVRDSDAETLRALHAHAPPPHAPPPDALLAHQRWLDVLGRDRLGARFYHTLAATVAALAESAVGVDDPAARADLALLTTTRALFLAFLQAKGWLDGDHAFLPHQYDACMAAGGSFHRRVLRPLFFGTLNTPRRHRASAARAFGRIPFLNGGLFALTPLERRHRALRLDDAALGALVHDLLGRYRFTAREDAATWSEAAVDPAMLGRAFESLMHARERRTTGAFYTPAPIVERATAAALRAALLTPPPGAPTLPESLVDDALAGVAAGSGPHTHALYARVARLRVLDPACGSGAFLVHALERLATLLAAAGDPRSVAERRRALLTTAIFGVDRNPTAVWLCELRLWLSCVIEADDDAARLAPLPNLDHNIRVGDALATPPGAPALLADAAHAWGGAPWGAGPPLGGATLAAQRARYARRSGARKRAAARQLDAAERARALDALDRTLAALRHERRETLAHARARDLFGTRPPPSPRTRARLDALRRALRTASRARAALADGGALPFGYAWHFADVGAAGGFDVVVGNPPWVRPHALPPAERLALRNHYRAVRDAAWRAGATLAGAGTGFAGQADLAVPFVERALALLRPGGALALLVPAKLWRALAGGGLRALLARESHLLALEDWSDAPAMFDAAAYPSLLVAARPASPAPTPQHVRIAVHRGTAVARDTLPAATLPLDPGDSASPWPLLPVAARAAFDALRDAGPPLAASGLPRPTLGVKCGCNDAFLVHAEPGDGPLATVRAGDRVARVERELLRPVLRGEDLARDGAAPPDPRGQPMILWTHDPAGAPLRTLPPLAARWLAPWRTQLARRADVGATREWWTLFRVAAGDPTRPRVVWADLARAPAPHLLAPGDPTVALNSCYVLTPTDEHDARALATLLATPIAAAWLGALAEPARGGFRRHLAWTVALLPVPRDWAAARAALATAWDAPPAARTSVAAAAYALPTHRLAALLAWDAGLLSPEPADATVRAVRERHRRTAATALSAPIAPSHWRGSREPGTSC
jgi:SAM-dependent methyltransferase